MFRDHHRLQNKSGLTMVELLMTIGVLALLAAVSIPITKSYYQRARKVESQYSVISFLTAQQLYYIDNNTFWPLISQEKTTKTVLIAWNPGDRPAQPEDYRIAYQDLGIDFRPEYHRGYRIQARYQQSTSFEQFLDFRFRTNEGFHNDGKSDEEYWFQMYNRQDPANPEWSTNGKWEVLNGFWFDILGCPAWSYPTPCAR